MTFTPRRQTPVPLPELRPVTLRATPNLDFAKLDSDQLTDGVRHEVLATLATGVKLLADQVSSGEITLKVRDLVALSNVAEITQRMSRLAKGEATTITENLTGAREQLIEVLQSADPYGGWENNVHARADAIHPGPEAATRGEDLPLQTGGDFPGGVREGCEEASLCERIPESGKD